MSLEIPLVVGCPRKQDKVASSVCSPARQGGGAELGQGTASVRTGVGRGSAGEGAPGLLLEGVQMGADLGEDTVHGALGIDLRGDGRKGGDDGEGRVGPTEVQAHFSRDLALLSKPNHRDHSQSRSQWGNQGLERRSDLRSLEFWPPLAKTPVS